MLPDGCHSWHFARSIRTEALSRPKNSLPAAMSNACWRRLGGRCLERDIKYGVRIHWGLCWLQEWWDTSWPFLKLSPAEKQSIKRTSKPGIHWDSMLIRSRDEVLQRTGDEDVRIHFQSSRGLLHTTTSHRRRLNSVRQPSETINQLVR